MYYTFTVPHTSYIPIVFIEAFVVCIWYPSCAVKILPCVHILWNRDILSKATRYGNIPDYVLG